MFKWFKTNKQLRQELRDERAITNQLYSQYLKLANDGSYFGTTSTDELERRLESAKEAISNHYSECPDCHSDLYTPIMGNSPRCFECGYPVIQQFSGVAAPAEYYSKALGGWEVKEQESTSWGEIIGRLKVVKNQND